MNKDIFQFGNGAITEIQWNIIKDFILKNEIKMLVEIGSGYSTFLFSKLPLKIYSFETNKSFIELISNKIENPQCKIIHYVYPGFPFLDVTPGLVFVDGPTGTKDKRKSSVRFASKSCNKIFIHDAERLEERNYIDSVFKSKWTETKYPGGLSYFEK